LDEEKKYKTKRKDPWTPFNEKHQTSPAAAAVMLGSFFVVFSRNRYTHARKQITFFVLFSVSFPQWNLLLLPSISISNF
jgi:hypothetical protein